MLRVFISIYLAFNGLFNAVISHQSGTAQAALQVAGASPTGVDQTLEHIVSPTTPYTYSRVTADFQGNLTLLWATENQLCHRSYRGMEERDVLKYQPTPI